MSPFAKNFQRLLIFFFAAGSIVLVFMGISRSKGGALSSVPTPGQEPASTTPQSTTPVTQSGKTFAGKTYQTPWGNVVASITVTNGKITGVTMPQVPPSPPSQYAEQFLVAQALAAGSANIQGVSGATYTSLAFKSSLESAIALANTTAGAKGQATIVSSPTTVTAPASTQTSVPRRYRHDDEWDD